MNYGLIDCDLLSLPGHKFPNLGLMKLSSYHKRKGDNVDLVNYEYADTYSLFHHEYDYFYAAKVFSKTKTPIYIQENDIIKVGGSGFYYDHNHGLPYEIEHIMPDYDLYTKYKDNDYYNKYSIGFLTRGCFRKCPFCINKDFNRVNFHANIDEFLDKRRPYIMLLDDNITGYSGFYNVFDSLDATGKKYVFKQGMDFRILSLKKMQRIWRSNYLSGKKSSRSGRIFYYAFDDINDYNIIEQKLNLYFSNLPYRSPIIFYVLTGFDRKEQYDSIFFEKDIRDCLKRIELLFNYGAFAYVMLHENYIKSPYASLLNELKNICNAPMNVAGKMLGDSLIQKGYINTYEWLKMHEPSMLKVRQNYKSIKHI